MNSRLEKTAIGKPAVWLTAAAASIGLDYSGLSLETTDQFKAHVIKRHGNPALHGRATITEADFEKIPGIIDAPDMAIIGARRGQSLCDAYAKMDGGGTYIYIDEVLNSTRNKTLRGHTFYRIHRQITIENFIRIVTMNNKTDIRQAKIIAAGGHPGGEAD